MCCRCCSETQQKSWVFGFGTVFIILGMVFMIWFPTFAEDTVYKLLPLKDGGITYNNWFTPPVPAYFYIYLFNWTNPEKVREPGVKPHFDRVGPYVFREDKKKRNVTWYPNNTVSFQTERTWHHEPELSGGALDDLVTVPHVPSIAATHIFRDANRAVKMSLNIALNSNGGALYSTHKAIEWIFDGFYDQFLDFAMKLGHPDIKSNRFAFFLDRNGTSDYEGVFLVNTGADDLHEMGELKYWNGNNYTDFFDGECARVNGSTTDLFVPKRGPEEWVTIFMRDLCRIINMVPIGNGVVEGIEGIRYETQPDTFDNGDLNPDMKCYCPVKDRPNNCPKTGLTDISACSEGAPLYLSHSSFRYADPSYMETVSGTVPDEENDAFYLIMEPRLGVPLEVNAAAQATLLVQSDSAFTILKDIPKFYAPVFVLNIKARVDESVAYKLKLVLNLGAIGFYTGVGFLCVGVILVAIGICLTYTNNWYKPKADEQSLID